MASNKRSAPWPRGCVARQGSVHIEFPLVAACTEPIDALVAYLSAECDESRRDRLLGARVNAMLEEDGPVCSTLVKFADLLQLTSDLTQTLVATVRGQGPEPEQALS